MLTTDRRLRKSFGASVGVAIQSGQCLLDPDGPDVSRFISPGRIVCCARGWTRMSQFHGDWSAFIERIASMLRAGRDEIEVSSEFSDCTVRWKGRLLEKNLHERYAPGVSLEMRPEQVSLESGKRLRGDYLFVNVDKDMADQWDAVPIGVEVEFTARISKQAGPFPGIAISAADDDQEAVLMVGAYEGRPL